MSVWYRWNVLLLLGVCLLQPLVSAEDIGATISEEDLRPHLEFLASPERGGRDDWGKVESRNYIIKHFRDLGLQPLFEEAYVQVVPQFGATGDDPEIAGQNVGAYVTGTHPELKHEWIIVTAHYDHLGIRKGKVYPGADDNASGVAMLLEVARHLRARPAARSVAFLSCDLEEHLLWGSRWFVAHPPMERESIRFCIAADMIGRSLGGLEIPSVFVLGAEHSICAERALESVVVPQGLELSRLGVDLIGIRSDYGPFFTRRIPFLFFSTGEHPDYHTPNDTLQNLDIERNAQISTVIQQVVRRVADDPAEITWRGTTAPDLEEVRTIHRVTSLLLEADTESEGSLTDLQRFFISQIRSRTAYLLSSGKMSDAERAWLKRATQIMMYSTF